MNNMVDNPAHYGGADNPYEHVKVAEALGWDQDAMIYNATKYLWRVGKKDAAKAVEDLRKAVWYIERKIKRLEALQAEDAQEVMRREAANLDLSRQGFVSETPAERV